MPTNFPTGITSKGIPVEGGGIGSPLFTSGDVYWVNC